MTRLIAISRKLSAEGYDVRTIVKNRVKKTAIGLPVVGMPSPVVYLDDILKYKSEESDESIIKFVKEELSKPPAGFPQSFAEDILAADSLKNHIYVGVQQESNEDLVKIKMPIKASGIEAYLYIYIEFDGKFIGTMKLKNAMLDSIVVDLNTLTKWAIENTCKVTKATKMGCMLEELGHPVEDADIPMIVITNERGIYGAACAIFNIELQEVLAESFGTKSIVLLPSSIHECLALPYTNEEDLRALSSMVSSINIEAIEPEEILGGKAIKIDCGV